jgi:hypothetical protein
LEPGIDHPVAEAQDQLPEAELLGGEAAALVPFDPVAQGGVVEAAPQPLDRIPGTRCEDAADDLILVPVPAQAAGVEVPEEWQELTRKGLSTPPARSGAPRLGALSHPIAGYQNHPLESPRRPGMTPLSHA